MTNISLYWPCGEQFACISVGCIPSSGITGSQGMRMASIRRPSQISVDHWRSSLVMGLFKSVVHFLQGCLSWKINSWKFFVYFGSVFFREIFYKYLLSVDCIFILLSVPIGEQKFLIIIYSSVFLFAFSLLLIGQITGTESEDQTALCLNIFCFNLIFFYSKYVPPMTKVQGSKSQFLLNGITSLTMFFSPPWDVFFMISLRSSQCPFPGPVNKS